MIEPNKMKVYLFRALYGPAVAKELVEFKLEDSRYQLYS